MEIKKIDGIIIGLAPHREFDRTVTVFSKEYGRVKIIAKGVRRITSHRSFHLDLFNHVRMELESSSKKIFYLREVTTLHGFPKMKTNALHFASACVIASLLLRIIPEGAPQEDLYELTHKTFEALNRASSKNPRPLLQTYLLKALKSLGHLPNKLPQEKIGSALRYTLDSLDPQLTLAASRTFGIFSKLNSTRSS